MATRRSTVALRSPKLLIPSCLLVALAHTLSLAAQIPTASATTPSLTLNARTVIVDVVVTGKNGRPVSGLLEKDFAIAEDGHPQEITTFEEHAGTQPAPALPPLPPNVFTNIPRAAPAGSPIVLLFDSLNTPLTDQVRVHKQVLNYLQHLQPGIPMAIFTLGSQLRFIQSFTDDPALLRSVIRNVKSGSGPQASTLLDSKTESTAQTAAAQITLALQQFQSEQTASQGGARTLITLSALQQLARYLAGIPGRKSVIWFSGAFPSIIFPDQALSTPSSVQRDFADEIRKTDAALAAAQIAIYPLAAEGLANDSLYDLDTQLTGHDAYEIQQQSIANLKSGANLRNADHATMDKIAEDTGGKAFYNTNDLNKAIQRVAEDGSQFYTLSYTPARPSPAEHYRTITVSLKDHPHDHLAYHRGYFPALPRPAKEIQPNLDPLRPYMQPGEPDSTEIPLALIVQRAAPPDTEPASDCSGDNRKLNAPLTCYVVSFVIAARGLQFTTSADGTRNDSIDVTLLAFNSSGKTLNWIVRHVNLDLDPSHYAEVLSEGIHFSLTIGMPKGTTDLSGGVFDPSSGRAGTLTVPIAAIVTANR